MTAGFDLPEGVSLRQETESDLPFLIQLYHATRADELALVDWSDEQKDAFVRMQFAAQRQHYQREYPGARFQVIERAGAPVGRLYVHERADEIRIMDIALAPPARNQGIGGRLLDAVLAEGARSRRPVTIHVERFNPARRLYERRGFRCLTAETDDTVYLLYEARPVPPA